MWAWRYDGLRYAASITLPFLIHRATGSVKGLFTVVFSHMKLIYYSSRTVSHFPRTKCKVLFKPLNLHRNQIVHYLLLLFNGKGYSGVPQLLVSASAFPGGPFLDQSQWPTSAVSIISLFYSLTSLVALKCNHPNFSGMCCTTECQEQAANGLSWRNILFSYCVQCKRAVLGDIYSSFSRIDPWMRDELCFTFECVYLWVLLKSCIT